MTSVETERSEVTSVETERTRSAGQSTTWAPAPALPWQALVRGYIRLSQTLTGCYKPCYRQLAKRGSSRLGPRQIRDPVRYRADSQASAGHRNADYNV